MQKMFKLVQNEFGELSAVSTDPAWQPQLFILDARPIESGVLCEIKLGEQWVRNSEWWANCRGCGPRIWIGWQVDGEWFVRGKCPKCGDETCTMYARYKAPRPERPYGGTQSRTTAARRERSGY